MQPSSEPLGSRDRSRAWLAGLALCLLIASPAALGADLAYVFQGTATGTAGGVPFNSAAFTLSFRANTANIANLGPGFYSVTASGTTITIAGIGSGSFTNPKRVFVYQPALVAGFGVAPNGADELDLQHPDLSTYDLSSTFGPVSVASPSYLQISNDPSSLGPITFNSATALTFEVVISVPTVSILRIPGAVVVHWPADATGYSLQSTTNIASSTAWTPVTNVPVVVGSENFVTNQAQGKTRYYRLRK